MTEREKLIAKVLQAEEKADTIHVELMAVCMEDGVYIKNTPAMRKRKKLQERYSSHRRNILCLQSQVQAMLPVQIEGVLSETEDEVDCDEHGRVMEIVHFLGCPTTYKFQNDITEILKLNAGKYLRVTIEPIKMDTSKCNNCKDRFKCYTTKWRS